MIVDPSLAKGLRKSFWRYTRDCAKESSLALIAIKARHWAHRPFSQKSFRRFVNEVLQNAPASTLVLTKLEGRRQFVACIYLDDIPDYPLNEWNEHILGGRKLKFGRDGKFDASESRARIGEHAVQRLFQRVGAQFDGNGEFDFDTYSIDIRNALAWSELLWLVPHALKAQGKPILAVFAPTPTGAFVGQHSSVGDFVDFRTFIGIDQMFAAQRTLWSELRAIEADVGLDAIGLRHQDFSSTHSVAMRAMVRVCEVMVRYPQITSYVPAAESLK